MGLRKYSEFAQEVLNSTLNEIIYFTYQKRKFVLYF